MIEIYTDGSSRGNPGPGGWGAIILGSDNVIELGGRDAHTTNNKMELLACICALEFAASMKVRVTTVYTDSQYVIKGITEWIHGWKKNNWKNSQKKDVLNQELWQELDKARAKISVTWKHVRGHSGDPLNERADEIATMFADDEPTKLYTGTRTAYVLYGKKI